MSNARRIAVLLAVAIGISAHTAAQKLPGGTVVPPPARDGLKHRVKTKLSTSPTSALLIVVTTPNAEISLDGKPTGHADAQGQFEKEIPAGAYQLRVSAGADFAPGERRIVLQPRRRELISLPLVSRYGTLVLSVPRLDGAAITVDTTTFRFDAQSRLAPALGTADVSVDAEKLTVTLSRVAEGGHAVRFECPGLAPDDTSVTVRGGETQVLAFRAEPTAASVDVTSEPDTSLFLNGAQWGRTDANGRFSGRVAAGEHVIRFERSGYEPAEQKRIFQAGETARVEQRLTPTLTTVGFGDDFELGLGRWEAPAQGWRMSNGALLVAGSPTPGLARGIFFRDFVFSFNLTLAGPGGAAWVVRARDGANYYLFYLSGPSGRFANRFAVYVVRDGKLDLDAPASAPVPVASDLGAGGEYYVEVTARGNRIATRITPLSTGVAETLGEFVDPQDSFPSGGIGFRSVQGEQFEVDDAYADPPKRK